MYEIISRTPTEQEYVEHIERTANKPVYLDGLTQPEIAEILGVSQTFVYRAIKKFKKLLAQELENSIL